MLYNKNNVRKTNDKKILHKVGKQWKVVSVALLMAIGGGAAVAATNNTSANADANNGSQYTMNAQTSAEVQSLEANPEVGQSSAPASQSSKASSASAKAPTMPSLSLNPDPSLNGHNADAQYNRVKQAYDNAAIKYYGNKVNSYVNFVNAKYPSAASNVNSKYDAASSNQSNDRSLASSYAATASGKNWSAEVSNIASAKSGIDASAYIETVGYNVSSSASNVSARANALSGASAIASYAALISEINSNVNVSGNYNESYRSASANSVIANTAYTNARLLASNFVTDSNANQNAYFGASAESVELSANDKIAVANSGLDASFVSSIASGFAGATSADQYSNASNAVSEAASEANNGSFGDNNGISNISSVNSALSNLSSANSVIAANSSAANSYAKLSAESSAVSAHNNSLNAFLAHNPNNSYSGTVTGAINQLASLAASANVVSGETSAYYANSLDSFANKRGISLGWNVNVSASANGNFKVTSTASYKGHTSEVVLSTGSTHAIINSKEASLNNKFAHASSGAYNDVKNASASASNDNSLLTTKFSDAYRVLSDTATQQQYGHEKSVVDSTVASAKAASAKYSAEVSSANDALNVASANSASASSAVNNLAILGNHPTMNAIEYGENGYTALVPYASASAFYNSYNVNSLLDNANEASAVADVTSAANQAGKDYTSASNASEAYAKSTDADFVLASSYANSYENKSGSDQSAFNSASAVRSNFYDTYAGNNYGSDADQLASAQSDEPNAAGLANGNATYVLKHEPHVVTVNKQLVLHSNPNYNDKADNPADSKLAVINKGTHLLVNNVGFDKHGNTRLYVNYNGKKGFITGLRTYVANSYLVAGQKYSVTFARTANEYKSLQFNHASAVKNASVKAGQTVTGTAVLNDDGSHFLGLTRLQLSNGNYVTTRDTYIKSYTPLNANGQANTQKGAYFWNGQDTTFLNK